MNVKCDFNNCQPSQPIVQNINIKAQELKNSLSFQQLHCTFDAGLNKNGVDSPCTVVISIKAENVSFESSTLDSNFQDALNRAWNKISSQINHWCAENGLAPIGYTQNYERIDQIWKAG